MIKNKKTKIATILAIMAALGILTSGCAMTTSTENSCGFYVLSKTKSIGREMVIEVVDMETGVHYYVNTEYQQGFMSPVYNSDGTIKVDKEHKYD